MDLNRLSPLQQKIVREVLLETFSAGDLDMLLSDHFNKRLDAIAPPGSFSTVLFHVIDRSLKEGWTDKLLKAVQEARPQNQRIRNLTSQLRSLDVREDKTKSQQSLEAVIRKARFPDLASWTAKLVRLQRAICTIEDPRVSQTAIGTGFLIDRDLVLTNFHVVEKYVSDARDNSQLVCRFDPAAASGNEAVGAAIQMEPGRGWIVHYSNELDYALLRLTEPVGNAPGLDGDTRGWVTPSRRARLPEIDGPFVVIQPHTLAIGKIIRVSANRTRIQYDANTDFGSSGSPCVDADLNLIALHQGDDPNAFPTQFNQGVPMAAILTDLIQSGVQPFWI
jgi:Trypsin-like peptidase domain/Effector-associated domain 1